MSTDTLSDVLTCIRNAGLARHRVVRVPCTKLVTGVVRVLCREGYVKSFTSIKTKGKTQQMAIVLRYVNGEPLIRRIQRVSKPGKRRYTKVGAIPKVRQGFGLVVLTTSYGIMSGEDARVRGVGGEVLCTIW